MALRAADVAASLVKQIKHAPPKQLEEIAAQSGIAIKQRDFAGWYSVFDALRKAKGSGWTAPSEQEFGYAYQAYL